MTDFLEYPQNGVNEPVPLHEGRFRLRWNDQVAKVAGSARLRWLPATGIELDVESPDGLVHALLNLQEGKDRLRFFDSVEIECLPVDGAPDFEMESPSVVSIPCLPSLGALCGKVRARVREMESGGAEDLRDAGFQVVNFVDTLTRGLSAAPGDPTTLWDARGADQTAGFRPRALRLEHDGWRIDLVVAPNSPYDGLRSSGGYACTHVGRLTRVDGSAFSAAETSATLESLTAFLSFARGADCNIPIRWGRGRTGEVVWRKFASPVVDPWSDDHRSWFDACRGDLLTELFGPFCRKYNDPTLSEPLRLALHWHRRCNTNSSGLEGSLILGMAGLELLSALIVAGKSGTMSARKHDKESSKKRLRLLLSALGLEPGVPPGHDALEAFRKNNDKCDACAALAELRNGFVHAKEKRRKIVFAPDTKKALAEAWQLSLWYQELALLYLLGWQGEYGNRTVERMGGELDRVPWSDQ